ncbi:MAG TPA: hypothetical protein VMV04_05440 [Thermodesulfobacteriota bacterium]|nr:hypothetical protein [Thermodesulfobacteriota bacterium]
MPSNLIILDGKKFIWDGVDHSSGEKISEAANKYKTDGFEVELHEEDGKTYLYTRRVVKHVVVSNA